MTVPVSSPAGADSAGELEGTGEPPAPDAPPYLTEEIIEIAEPAVPVSRIPAVLLAALRIVWRAARPQFIAISVVEALEALGIALSLLLGRDLIAVFLQGDQPGRGGLPLARMGALLALTAGVAVCGLVRRERSELLAELTSHHLRRQVVDIASTVPLERFDDAEFHDHLQRVTMGSDFRPMEMVQGLTGLIGALLGMVGVGAALVAIEPALALLTIFAGLPVWLASTKTGGLLFQFVVDMTPSERTRSYIFSLLCTRDAAKEVRAFGTSRYLIEKHDALFRSRIEELRRLGRRRLAYSVAGTLTVFAVVGGAILIVFALAYNDRLTLAEAGTAAAAILLLSQRMMSTAIVTAQVYEAAPFMEDLTAFVQSGDSTTVPSPRLNPSDRPSFSMLRAKDISFTYPGATRPAIHDVSIRVAPGEVVALVGENGSGKTTLAKVLGGLYRADSGKVSWDGVDVASLPPNDVFDNTSAVFQDFLRYFLSVRENIGLGRSERIEDSARVVRSARTAGIHDTISQLAEAYETRLGPEFEGATDLSLGQWQKIAVARGFFREAGFMILDEPTASLDAKAEHELFQILRTVLKDRSALLISHRFSTVRSADRIYFLENGTVVEEGTHDDLMAIGGRYAHLFSLQAAAYS